MDVPVVSIVVPTFSRPEKLRVCLEGIAGLRTDGLPFEVIVVNDGGPDPLAAVVAEFAGRLTVELLMQEHGGPGKARNTGASAARGRYIAFLDDDCLPSPDWLLLLVRELERNETRLLGGRVENGLPDNPYSEASEWIGRFVYDYNRDPRAHEPFFTTNNVALSTALFREMAGFTTAIPSATAEDKDFADRWRARGLMLHAVPAAVVYHSNDLTFRRFWRQHFNYGRGILAFRLLRRSRVEAAATARRGGRATGVNAPRSPIVPEPFRFYAGLVFSPIVAPGIRGRARLLALLVVSQLATLAGALSEARRSDEVRRPAERAGIASSHPSRDLR